jgi:hypothetical protein
LRTRFHLHMFFQCQPLPHQFGLPGIYNHGGLIRDGSTSIEMTYNAADACARALSCVADRPAGHCDARAAAASRVLGPSIFNRLSGGAARSPLRGESRVVGIRRSFVANNRRRRMSSSLSLRCRNDSVSRTCWRPGQSALDVAADRKRMANAGFYQDPAPFDARNVVCGVGEIAGTRTFVCHAISSDERTRNKKPGRRG